MIVSQYYVDSDVSVRPRVWYYRLTRDNSLVGTITHQVPHTADDRDSYYAAHAIGDGRRPRTFVTADGAHTYLRARLDILYPPVSDTE